MTPIAYWLIGLVAYYPFWGSLPTNRDPLMLGYRLTWIPVIPFLAWQVLVELTPNLWFKMDTMYKISLLGNWWFYLWIPFFDTIMYALAF